jgi:hypothetical protein
MGQGLLCLQLWPRHSICILQLLHQACRQRRLNQQCRRWEMCPHLLPHLQPLQPTSHQFQESLQSPQHHPRELFSSKTLQPTRRWFYLPLHQHQPHLVHPLLRLQLRHQMFLKPQRVRMGWVPSERALINPAFVCPPKQSTACTNLQLHHHLCHHPCGDFILNVIVI